MSAKLKNLLIYYIILTADSVQDAVAERSKAQR